MAAGEYRLNMRGLMDRVAYAPLPEIPDNSAMGNNHARLMFAGNFRVHASSSAATGNSR